MPDRNRINRVITRSGDRGRTGLADGSRLSKVAPVIEALGEMDELNAALGVLLVDIPEPFRALVASLQQVLFEIGAELAVPGSARLTHASVAHLEEAAGRLNESLPPLREFVLPGGDRAGAWCHYCRTLARRAERRLVAVADAGRPADEGGDSSPETSVNPVSLIWLNRLSDLLFILARELNRQAGVAEAVWQPGAGQ